MCHVSNAEFMSVAQMLSSYITLVIISNTISVTVYIKILKTLCETSNTISVTVYIKILKTLCETVLEKW